RDTSFNWVFLVLSSIITVALLILCGLGIFCFLTNRKQQRNTNLSRGIFLTLRIIF
ncbi:unnamed protein product, partial [Rotaria magnacalcarata]